MCKTPAPIFVGGGFAKHFRKCLQGKNGFVIFNNDCAYGPGSYSEENFAPAQPEHFDGVPGALNHPDISEANKRKVKELAALMDYEPNNYAVKPAA